ncbi:2-keto-4-pentenoate hydratase [Antricoccus suffuscus]|uniref:2-keto-4-pentenoate hydratase n=1 Tax=Antricoccus suffuscus TaxID=1629062 RepID=A0A2T1A624_9ACTN|nr:hypothetical protein [Antricoccus suffuscus]PRZ44036.1 2-keto-4-pentenoate hydratase [Antricoccus suffuscus]
MTNDADLNAWVDRLTSAYDVLEARTDAATGDLNDFPPALNDLAIDDAYRVQELTLERLRSAYGGTPRGYKVGGGASLMRGTLLDTKLLPSGAHVNVAANNVPLVEPEILLRTTADLSGDVSTSDIAGSVEMGAGFELPIGRFRNWHPTAPGAVVALPAMAADNGLAGLLVLGDSWRPGLDPEELTQVTAEVRFPGGQTETGRANPKVGTAYDTTQWLIRSLNYSLPKGSIIATGTLLPARPATPGEYSARFSHDLGEVRFTAA